tara:strand:- start:59 stop:535 length:477 start_codon:yes stop_codon:yes gene_type:complete
MKPIDVAVKFIKALPEQQSFTMREQLPTLYGQDMTAAPSFISLQRRRGTIHPAILGMIERRQSNYNAHMPFPDRRLRFGSPNSERYGTIMAQGPMNEMTYTQGEFSNNNSRDAGQRVRGSVFDAGHYNKFGLPMVGVRQPNYQEQRKPLNPELNRGGN